MCNSYSKLSCCLSTTADQIQGKALYQLHRLTCNKPMSSGCKKFFQQDACLYECSPHLGQWIVEDNVGETLQNVPLCQSECEKWFTACINDFTCTRDWKTSHANSHFTCTAKDKCQTFRDKFQSAEHFCNTIWGNSYVVVPDDQMCVKIDGSIEHETRNNAHGNKTAIVAEEKNGSRRKTAALFAVLIPIVASNFV
ncbi:Folate receptor family [Nesidiocoris tenuis]|uniref:Folate receptor family n=1 Tax=Nesidiocoris tenuis TaxID=355587 RepID=A0ABN7AGW4_9HEMI|nr:Folate receptor family [Nesidiocoris tenuis]